LVFTLTHVTGGPPLKSVSKKPKGDEVSDVDSGDDVSEGDELEGDVADDSEQLAIESELTTFFHKYSGCSDRKQMPKVNSP